MALRIQNGSGRSPHASQATTKINFASSSATLPVSASEPTEISKDSTAHVSSSLPRETKPLKGILMNQGFRSQDNTPNSSPRATPSTLPPQIPSSSVSPSTKKPDPPVVSQKRSMTSSAVADFLKKFSPKLTRSKKSLQWYTVDIQPTVQPDKFSSTSRTSAELETDPTIHELQTGRISSEFSSEMSECLSQKNLDVKSRAPLPVGVVAPPATGPQSARSAVPARTAQDRTDFLQQSGSSSSARSGIKTSALYSSPVSKSMPATPVAHNNHHQPPISSQEWRVMMVDIDVDRTENQASSAARQKKMDYLGDLTAGLRNHHSQVPMSAPGSADRSQNGHIPSYLRLSRALNGYSARNMYTARKPISARDYNVALCRSEEFLNRPTSRSDREWELDERLNQPRPPPLSAKDLRNQPTRDDIRRAASEGRDLSGVKSRLVMVEFSEASEPKPTPPPTVGTDKLAMISEKAGFAFLRKLDTEMDKLRQLVQKGQLDLEAESGGMPEDVKDHLRSAVGKTNLLLSQKCAQFSDLCNKNINELPGDSLKTTPSDLEGFWDLLGIQIKKCHDMFQEVSQSKNGSEIGLSASWDSPDTIPKSKLGTGKVESRSGSRRSSSTERVPTAPSSRRSSKSKVTFQLTEKDVQRKEMIAAKRREFEQQQQLLQHVAPATETALVEPDVHIFVPAASAN